MSTTRAQAEPGPIEWASVENGTICSWVGVPRKASTNALTPSSTMPTAPPIEPESSTISATGPPQREFARTKEGTLNSSASISEVVVPPAVRLMLLVPPPAPSTLPPPSIVTRMRRALVLRSSSSGSFGTVTPMTQSGWVGLASHAGMQGLPHSTRSITHSSPFWMYWYCTRVITSTGGFGCG